MLDLEKLVIDHLRSFNEQLPEKRRLAEGPDAVVIGPDSSFDSLDAVEFMMGIEDKIAALVGRRIDLCHRVEDLEQESVALADVTVCLEQLVAQAPMLAD